jgi:hypothetical protein
VLLSPRTPSGERQDWVFGWWEPGNGFPMFVLAAWHAPLVNPPPKPATGLGRPVAKLAMTSPAGHGNCSFVHLLQRSVPL